MRTGVIAQFVIGKYRSRHNIRSHRIRPSLFKSHAIETLFTKHNRLATRGRELGGSFYQVEVWKSVDAAAVIRELSPS